MTNPVAYLKEWTVNGESRSRVDLTPECETWLEEYHPTVTPLVPQSSDPEQKILSWLKANARKGRSTVSINLAPNGDITLDNLHAESAGGCIHCGGEHE